MEPSPSSSSSSLSSSSSPPPLHTGNSRSSSSSIEQNTIPTSTRTVTRAVGPPASNQVPETNGTTSQPPDQPGSTAPRHRRWTAEEITRYLSRDSASFPEYDEAELQRKPSHLLTTEEKKVKRILANRRSARNSHNRKKQQMEDMQTELSSLKAENHDLREHNTALVAQVKAMQDLIDTLSENAGGQKMGAVGTVASSDESGRARKRPKTASFTSQAHNKDESVRTNPGTKSQHHKPTADSKKAFGNSKAIESLGGGNLRSGSSDQGRSMTRFTTSLVETGFPTVNRNDNQIGSSPTHGQLHPLRSATSLAQSLKNMPTMEPSGTNLPSQTGETLTDTALLHRLNPASQNQPTISDMTAAILHDRSQGRHTTGAIPHSIFDHLLTGISEPSSSTRVAAAIATGAGHATASATMGRQLSSNLDPGIFQLYETTHS